MKSKVKNYWNNLIHNPDTDGIADMGSCGPIELFYRTYFESKTFFKLSNMTNKSILEIGCGSGRWGFILCYYVKKYVGIDISLISIKHARAKCKEMKIKNCVFYKTSVNKYHSKRKFDVIYYGGVSQYMDDKELLSTLKHLKKFLKPSGILIDRSTLSLEQKSQINSRKDYYALYRTEKHLTDIICRAGFKPEYSCKSYRFLRTKELSNILNNHFVIKLLNTIPHISYNALYLITLIRDIVNPITFFEEGIGKFTHNFTVCKLV